MLYVTCVHHYDRKKKKKIDTSLFEADACLTEEGT